MQRSRDVVFGARATTAQLYPGRDTLAFEQGHVTKNQPITALVLLSKSITMSFVIDYAFSRSTPSSTPDPLPLSCVIQTSPVRFFNSLELIANIAIGYC